MENKLKLHTKPSSILVLCSGATSRLENELVLPSRSMNLALLYSNIIHQIAIILGAGSDFLLLFKQAVYQMESNGALKLCEW